jgi:hypothetical protein
MRISFIAAALACLGLLLPLATTAARRPPVDIIDFMTGLACTESSGRFDARNERTGAFGKYQVMPRNWPVWAGRYLGNPWAPTSPRNQEFVVRERLEQLRANHRTWRNVAHWWLTGDVHENNADWSRHARIYVGRVMELARAAAVPAALNDIPRRCRPLDLRAPRIRTEPFTRLVITGGAVNVRRAAGYESRSIGVVRRGHKVALLGRGVDRRGQPWIKVGLADGRSGWVAAWYTRRVEADRR